MSQAALENYLFNRIAAALRAVPPAQARDAYAFYLVLSLDEAGGYRPALSSLAWLTQADVTNEKARQYGSRWSGWAASGEAVLSLCDEERDPEGFHLQTELYESLHEFLLGDDTTRRRWEAFLFAWPFRWEEEAMSEWERARFEAMLDTLHVPAASRRFLSSTLSALLPFDLSQALFPILAAVIRRLHGEGVLEEVCGRAVPVGVMATNDVGYEYGLEPTRLGNSAGLARGMEEWMMGEPYSAIEAREELEWEVQQMEPDEQARYWAQAALEVEEFFWNGSRTPLTDDLQKRGLIEREEGRHVQRLHLSRRLQDLLPLAAPHLVALAESRAGNAYNPDWSHKLPSDHAEHLLSLLAQIGPGREREKVPQSAIDALAALMHRLWPEYKAMRARRERTGFCLQYVVRALHALRPEQFPSWRQNPRDAGEFNFADYGLT